MHARKIALAGLALLALVLVSDATTYYGQLTRSSSYDNPQDCSGNYYLTTGYTNTRYFEVYVSCCYCTSPGNCYGCTSALDCSPARSTCSSATKLALGIIIAIVVIPIAIAIIVTIIVVVCCCCAAAAAAGGASGHSVSGSTVIVTQSVPVAQPVYVEETTYAQPAYVQTNTTVEMQAVPNQYGQPVYQQQTAPGYY